VNNLVKNNSVSKKAFWIAASFYLLIAFEFFYMATPFAIYFYSVYKPGLNFLNDNSTLSWLTGTFLPHIVIETKSVILNIRNAVGFILAIAGFVGFVFGAIQVYYKKITKKGIVIDGIYKIIRHPQYLSLMICSFGLLILWPRYLVLLSFITMLFVYYGLAKIEEGECERKFGEDYIGYRKRTYMFFPLPKQILNKINLSINSKTIRCFIIIIFYLSSAFLAVVIANNLKNWSLTNCYALYTKNSAFISLNEIEESSLKHLVDIALNNSEVKNRLQKERSNTKYINYILPPDIFLLEIPMNPIENESGVHFFSKTKNKNCYKIIFTKADFDNPTSPEGKDILLNVKKRTPLLEVTINLDRNEIVRIDYPTEKIKYENIPMPVF